jgi:hypothetical protein
MSQYTNALRTENKKNEDILVEILRRKVTNFMKVIAHSVRQSNYKNQNDNLRNYLNNTEDGAQQVEELGELSDNTYDKALGKINQNLNNGEYADEYQIKILATLLFNNGYPYIINVESTNSETTTTYPDLNTVPIYNMHLRFSDVSKHYDVKIPTELHDELLIDILNTYTTDENIINILGDGSCFYRSIAVWCRLYGITADHLNSLNYNIPFEYNIDSFNKNLKVKIAPKNPVDGISEPIRVDVHKYDIDKITNIANQLQNKLLSDTLKKQVTRMDNQHMMPTDEYAAKQLDENLNNKNKSCNENIRVNQ